MRRGGQVNGVVTLVTFFCALCLAMFAVLSLSTADRERELTELALRRTAEYYEADRQATERLAALNKESRPEGEETAFAVPAGEDLMLEVTTRREGGAERVLRWQTVYRGDWEAEDTMKVWTGD